MPVRLFFSALAAGLLLIMGSSPAMAQPAPPLPGQCDGPGSIQGTLGIFPQEGPAGSSALIDGSFQTFPAVAQESGIGVEAWWLETGISDAAFLTEFSLLIDDESLMASFGGNITIPPDAAPGPHSVALLLDGATDPSCLEFTVTESVQQDAYPAAAASTRLPETGPGLLVPAAGLAVAGLGLFLGRRRQT